MHDGSVRATVYSKTKTINQTACSNSRFPVVHITSKRRYKMKQPQTSKQGRYNKSGDYCFGRRLRYITTVRQLILERLLISSDTTSYSLASPHHPCIGHI